MTSNKWLMRAGLAAAFVGLVMWATLGMGPRNSANGVGPQLDGVAAWFHSGSTTTVAANQNAASAVGDASPLSQSKLTSPLDTMILPTFRATDKGTLVMDQQTRLDVERIHALFSRDEALAKLASQSAGLPDQAQRELKDLYQKYSQYAQAVAQNYPPNLSNGTLEEANQQLKGLHELRQQYFGVDGAQALFGEEEKTSQELLDLMHKQSDPKLSLEEKAEQAQNEWKQRQGQTKP